MPAGVLALGLVQGALAALNALGLVLIWRSTRVLNLAQPALGLVGGVLVGLLVASAGWSFWWAAPIGLAAGAVLGLASERLVLSRLQEAPRAVLLVVTIGIAQVLGGLQAALPFMFGGPLPTYTLDLGISMDLFPVHLSSAHLLTLLVLPIALAAMLWFMHRSRFGLAAVALGQDAERARALGIPAAVVRSVVWSVAGALSAASGILAIPVLGFSLGGAPGPTVLLFALAPAALAGLRSLAGATAAALTLGVAYQASLWWSPRAGIADLLLAATVVVAILFQRRRWGRAAGAERVSSWTAAATPRPLPWAVARSARIRVAFVLATGIAVAAVAVPPFHLGPADTLLYATTAALVLTAVGVAAAWMLGGEVALGHWGLAGMGAAAAALMPGPWPLRVALSATAVTLIGIVLGAASRGRLGSSYAVLGLAAAVAAPVLIGMTGGAPPLDRRFAGAITAGLAVLIAAGLIVLRASAFGVRLVAARDEPHRAPWLGVEPGRARLISLGLSASIAGIAGALYLSVLPFGFAPGAFDPGRSLDLVAMAVVGGIASPVGVLLGASVLQAGNLFLPGSWALMTSGVGLILVVMFLPAGLGHVVERVRDRLVLLLLGLNALPIPDRHHFQRHEPTDDPADVAMAHVDADGRSRMIAGSDTREALSTPTVRAAGLAAFFVAAPGWAAALGSSAAWRLAYDWGTDAGVWLTAGLLAVAGAVLGWGIRQPLDAVALRTRLLPRLSEDRSMAGLTALAVLAGLAMTGATYGTNEAAALFLLPVPVVSAYAAGRAVRIAAEACVPAVRPAAMGVTVASALGGLLPSLHLGLVAAGSGFARAALWSLAYVALGAVYVMRASRLLRIDRHRIQARMHTPAGPADDARTITPVSRSPAVPLAIHDAYVRFGGNHVLAGVSTRVLEGELLALVGGNGAGKSTLLRMAAGFVRPDGGRVLVRGEDVTMLRPEERAVTGLAFVSGARPIFPDLNVRDNLRAAAFSTHKGSRAYTQAVEAILDLVPLLRERDRQKAGVLSGGEQRLLAVAQAFFRRPAVLLADELSLGLDTRNRRAVLDLLRLLADQGMAIIAVDHDLPELLSRSDRAILLDEGTIQTYNQPTDILDKRADLIPATFLVGTAHD